MQLVRVLSSGPCTSAPAANANERANVGGDVKATVRKPRFATALLASFCLSVLLNGCSPDVRPGEAIKETPAPSADENLAGIEDSFSRMNYGDAATLAASGQQTFPGDARFHLAAARAQARLGDAEASAFALERARSAGLTDLQDALVDPAFDAVRGHPAFARFLTSPRATPPRRSGVAESESRIRAGDVEIIEGASGDYIRAGDVVLDTRQ